MNRFPNAARGVKKIYTAQILELIVLILTTLATVLTVAAGAAAVNGAAGVGAVSLLTGVVMIIAVVVIMIIAAIINLIGLSVAGRDEGCFKSALVFILICIVLSIVSEFTKIQVLKSIMNALDTICELVVMMFVVKGVTTLLPESSLVEKGRKITVLVVVVVAVGALCNILTCIPSAVLACTIMSAVCRLVYFFIYLSFLKQAKNEL